MKFLTAILIAFALAAPASTVAQTETVVGSRIPFPSPARPDFRSKLSEPDQARFMVDEFGRCTLQYSSSAVDEALKLIPGTEESSAALGALAKPRCLRNATLKMPPALLRGSLFRAKIIETYADRPIVFVDEALDYTTLVSDPEDPNYRRFAVLQSFASCIVRTRSRNAAAYVVEPAGSELEKEALQELIPALGPCLPEGLELQFSESMLGAQLAEALFRELDAAYQSGKVDA